MRHWPCYKVLGAVLAVTGSNSNCSNGATEMTDKYLYGELPAEVESAAGVKGVIVRTLDGATVFRVCHDREHFTDYEIRHDDLSVTIDTDELAAFYKVGERDILDHSPQVLGLKKIESE